ncbi:MAG: T9SS type A sorting domain-containing protein [Gemmatimonadaceae bacterium]|nr:T9SS type A sorting domain-containing protein [Chitinophagaceae bacterium]
MRRFLLCLLSTVIVVSVHAQRECHQQDYQQQLLSANPLLAREFEKVEAFTRNLPLTAISGINGSDPAYNVPQLIKIPVVIHVLYNNASQNISDAQIMSQLDALNNDFRGRNTDRSKTPAYFADLSTDAGFQFELAKIDPQGYATTGIIRKYTGIQNFSYDDRVKNSAIGGDDAWDADSYLNIWVCNTVGGILGYASAPGGPKEKDGVVLSAGVFGTIGIGGPFNKGRTAVHEVGHWLNLRHIWGDGYCGDDKVEDTPPQRSANRGCPTGEKFTCTPTAHGDMYMNYMDFVDDACMVMFTGGQKERMRSLFAPGGARHALLSSKAMSGEGMPKPAPVQPEAPVAEVKLLLFPNPAVSSITLQSGEDMNCLGKAVQVYNHLGQIMTTTIIKSFNQQINVSSLRSGIYYVKVEGSARGMAKFVKQ